MCGIAFCQVTDDSCLNIREVARVLLADIASRGQDATGFAYFDSDGTVVDCSLPVPAQKFIASRAMRGLDDRARTVILHTRAATQGSKHNPLNNHPVLAYDDAGATVALVHNGMIWNDYQTFAAHRVPRWGEVDTEIIPALIARYGSQSYAGIFAEVEGSIACAWLDERTPHVLHAVRASTSPMVVMTIDYAGPSGVIKGTFGASTVSALSAVLACLGLSWNTPGVEQYEIGEGEYFSLTAGEWDRQVVPFETPDDSYMHWGMYGSPQSRSQGWTRHHDSRTPSSSDRDTLGPEDQEAWDEILRSHAFEQDQASGLWMSPREQADRWAAETAADQATHLDLMTQAADDGWEGSLADYLLSRPGVVDDLPDDGDEAAQAAWWERTKAREELALLRDRMEDAVREHRTYTATALDNHVIDHAVKLGVSVAAALTPRQAPFRVVPQGTGWPVNPGSVVEDVAPAGVHADAF